MNTMITMNDVMNKMNDAMNITMSHDMYEVIEEMTDKLVNIENRIRFNINYSESKKKCVVVNDILSATSDAIIAILYNADSDKYLNYIADELNNVNLSLINLDLDFTESEYAVFKDCLNLVADCKELLNSLMDF